MLREGGGWPSSPPSPPAGPSAGPWPGGGGAGRAGAVGRRGASERGAAPRGGRARVAGGGGAGRRCLGSAAGPRGAGAERRGAGLWAREPGRGPGRGRRWKHASGARVSARRRAGSDPAGRAGRVPGGRGAAAGRQGPLTGVRARKSAQVSSPRLWRGRVPAGAEGKGVCVKVETLNKCCRNFPPFLLRGTSSPVSSRVSRWQSCLWESTLILKIA